MKKTKWKRKCPDCGILVYYSNKYTLQRAIDENRSCLSCATSKGVQHKTRKQHSRWCHEIDKHKDKIIELYKEKSIRQIAKMFGVSHHLISRRLNEWKIEIRNNIEESRRRQKEPDSLENKSKAQRIATIKRIEDRNGVIFPNYNIKAIPILEQKAKELGIDDLQHAENGGEYHIKELGYWADGYSLSKNIVIEYYELRHKYKQEKDKIREKQIKECLGCEFIIIKEREK